jgi:hypothetical protein
MAIRPRRRSPVVRVGGGGGKEETAETAWGIERETSVERMTEVGGGTRATGTKGLRVRVGSDRREGIFPDGICSFLFFCAFLFL